MKFTLCLFCGGNSNNDSELPKPLSQIIENKTLLRYYLSYLRFLQTSRYDQILLLCEDKQIPMFKKEINNFKYHTNLEVLGCGRKTSTFEKMRIALNVVETQDHPFMHFSYPDIFSFDNNDEMTDEWLDLSNSITISAAPLTSRFPRLQVNVYENQVKGISNYTSPIPANPLHIFGGDIWVKTEILEKLLKEFDAENQISNPSLEYDFLFWAINKNILKSKMLSSERILVDSIRDIQKLTSKVNNCFEIL
tara:strand:- start:362 stop:1111 length:750 start_codon:yes stop_codon:yes gene_type:complete